VVRRLQGTAPGAIRGGSSRLGQTFPPGNPVWLCSKKIFRTRPYFHAMYGQFEGICLYDRSSAASGAISPEKKMSIFLSDKQNKC
jgi:hypothetical protein